MSSVVTVKPTSSEEPEFILQRMRDLDHEAWLLALRYGRYEFELQDDLLAEIITDRLPHIAPYWSCTIAEALSGVMLSCRLDFRAIPNVKRKRDYSALSSVVLAIAVVTLAHAVVSLLSALSAFGS